MIQISKKLDPFKVNDFKQIVNKSCWKYHFLRNPNITIDFKKLYNEYDIHFEIQMLNPNSSHCIETNLYKLYNYMILQENVVKILQVDVIENDDFQFFWHFAEQDTITIQIENDEQIIRLENWKLTKVD